MPIYLKQSVVSFILLISFLTIGRAQAVINFKLGIESWSLKDEVDALSKSRHPGQFAGFDVFVQKNRAIFVPGFHYHRISVENENTPFNFDLKQHHHLHYFTIPMTAGYKLLDRAIWNLSMMAGGEVTFFYDLDNNNVGLDDDMLYGVSTGLTGIIQTEIASFLTFEVKYHHGLQPIIKIRDQSKLRGMTLAVGVKF